MSEPPDLARVNDAIVAAGFAPRGGFLCSGEDIPSPAGAKARTVVLVGSVGEVGFRGFRASSFWNDGADDPLDRYTEHVVDRLADALGALALYPHRGPPWLPFQRWAARAQPVHRSPLGLVIHPQHGLWHAYRGALAFAQLLAGVDPPRPEPGPCEGCAGQPCLAACPVGAFATGGFDAGACMAHLASAAGRHCMEHGCQARNACPVAPELRYRGEQCRFHMAAFAGASR